MVRSLDLHEIDHLTQGALLAGGGGELERLAEHAGGDRRAQPPAGARGACDKRLPFMSS